MLDVDCVSQPGRAQPWRCPEGIPSPKPGHPQVGQCPLPSVSLGPSRGRAADRCPPAHSSAPTACPAASAPRDWCRTGAGDAWPRRTAPVCTTRPPTSPGRPSGWTVTPGGSRGCRGEGVGRDHRDSRPELALARGSSAGGRRGAEAWRCLYPLESPRCSHFSSGRYSRGLASSAQWVAAASQSCHQDHEPSIPGTKGWGSLKTEASRAGGGPMSPCSLLHLTPHECGRGTPVSPYYEEGLSPRPCHSWDRLGLRDPEWGGLLHHKHRVLPSPRSTCRNRRWECSHQPCLGTCVAYGDGHFITFDGERYSFEGSCEYTLVQVGGPLSPPEGQVWPAVTHISTLPVSGPLWGQWHSQRDFPHRHRERPLWDHRRHLLQDHQALPGGEGRHGETSPSAADPIPGRPSS